MTDRNDELLLALGYKKLSPSSHAIQVGDASFWDRPDGVRLCYTPRPFDNLQDAVDCVPEGWRIETILGPDPTFENYRNKWVARIEPHNRNDKGWLIGPQVVEADTPAKALSEAILKAMEANHE